VSNPIEAEALGQKESPASGETLFGRAAFGGKGRAAVRGRRADGGRNAGVLLATADSAAIARAISGSAPARLA